MELVSESRLFTILKTCQLFAKGSAKINGCKDGVTCIAMWFAKPIGESIRSPKAGLASVHERRWRAQNQQISESPDGSNRKAVPSQLPVV